MLEPGVTSNLLLLNDASQWKLLFTILFQKIFVAYPKLHPFKRQMGNGKREDRLDALRGRERSKQCVSRKNF